MKFTVVIFALIAGLSKQIRTPHSQAHERTHLSSTNQIGQEGHKSIRLDENIRAHAHKLLKSVSNVRNENHECEEIITDEHGNKYKVVLIPVVKK